MRHFINLVEAMATRARNASSSDAQTDLSQPISFDSAYNEDGASGETWAANDDDELGVVKWHLDGGSLCIDMIETHYDTPLLGVKLLKATQAFVGPGYAMDPGMMTPEGKRLWADYQKRQHAK